MEGGYKPVSQWGPNHTKTSKNYSARGVDELYLPLSNGHLAKRSAQQKLAKCLYRVINILFT